MSKDPEPKTKLASDDPKFPPIEVRNKVLHAVSPAALIEWARDLGADACDKETAVNAILLHEYGKEAFDQYRGDWMKKKEEWDNRQKEAKVKLAEIEEKRPGHIKVFDIATAHLGPHKETPRAS